MSGNSALKVKINGKAYEAEKDEYILEVCRRNCIPVPTLCHHDSLSGLGACRLCVVEVNEGNGNKVVVSCVYPLNRDCEVFTDSEKIKGIRKTILSMLRTRAPEGDLLAALCQMYGVAEEKRFTVSRPEKGVTESPAAKRLSAACILCGRCALACSSLGTGAISTMGRGTIKKVSTPYDEASADCIGCGSCAEVCPTKAIEYRETKGQRSIWGRDFKILSCTACGKDFATEEEYTFARKKAARETAGETLPSVLCETCRRRKSSDVFAAAFGERI
ncbi:MAG: (2Fe-2S)-binding protein [Treponema sp.]|jgi:NADH dehydrogenase/NADH:ubiquinone oxidoreductase subunit G|nr:(2Fe-2S)-binding protein [Treponema sp.]